MKLACLVAFAAACSGKDEAPSKKKPTTDERRANGPADDPLVEADLAGPAADVTRSGAKPSVPAIPELEAPALVATAADPKALLVQGKALLDRDITVVGYVTWIYDCVKDVARPGETPAQTQARIDDDMSVCERKKLYLGSTKDTPPERSISVVDVPRPQTAREKRAIKDWPDVPKVEVGDYVAITGRWALTSPHSERNPDGFLVYASLAPATPSTPAPAKAPAASWPTIPAIAPVPMPKVLQSVKDSSLQAMNEGTVLHGRKQFEAALSKYKAAVATWPENHAAWFYLADIYVKKEMWGEAVDAARRAVAVRPDEAMYRQELGLVLYEKARVDARTAQGATKGVVADFSKASFDDAVIELLQAVKLNAQLWRSHYLLGSIARYRQQPVLAAQELSRAVESTPLEEAPYVALAELYRAWDRFDEAIQVAELGTKTLPALRAKLWYEIGAANREKHLDDKAIEAFTRSLAEQSDLKQALFARGQAYFRKGDYASAKKDLEAFTRAGARSDAFSRVTANEMLQIAAGKP